MMDTKSFKTIATCIVLSSLLFSCQTKSNPNEVMLRDNWSIQSSALTFASGQEISNIDFIPKDWYKATVPSTVFSALRNNGLHKNVFFGKNLDAVSTAPFDTSWWYRTTFFLSKKDKNKFARFFFDGINYKADIWLNGEQIGSADTISGAFRTFSLNVSKKLLAGKNILALKVFPPKPGDFTIGFVDWNPTPPDKNMGVWRPVRLRLTEAVSINDPFIRTKLNLQTLNEADITVSVKLTNHSERDIRGKLLCTLESKEFGEYVSLLAGETKTVVYDAEKYSELHLENPRIWWPNNLGQPELYKLELQFLINNRVSDRQEVTFGVRDVEDYMTEEGYRGYKINGKKILIRGGGWVDDIFLADTPEKLEAQVRYVKHMNLNTIRLEGFWGKDHALYDLCDRYGILIMAGWSCQWEWENYLGKACDDFGGIASDEDIDLVVQSWEDQITMFRNHPSLFVWIGGSDKLPRPKLEKRYLQILEKTDTTRPYLAAAGGLESEVSGPTGVKMNGPYDYVPPIYWYIDRQYGGAYGFNTETGPGPQPPPLESLQKMLPPENLWPIDDVWEFHCGRNEFNTLNRYKEAMDKRYGAPKNIKDFARTAQIMNYEAMRAMFEAFAINKYHTTGIIQWMLNSAWPELYWQLYDYYLMPTGAFYAARKAAAPLQIIYNYGNRSLYINNDFLKAKNNLNVAVKLLDTNSNVLIDDVKSIAVEANSVKKVYTLPKQKDGVTFLFISLKENGRTVAHNVYWLAPKEDVMDFAASEWFVTPVKEYADFTALRKMPQAKVQMTYAIEEREEHQYANVSLHNVSDRLAFFIRLKLVDEKNEMILPVFWDDNYISLLPGEKKLLTAEFYSDEAHGLVSVVMDGWNLSTTNDKN